LSLARDLVCDLLAQSLLAWGVAGRVAYSGDGAILINADRASLRIDQVQEPTVFRWTVTAGGRKRAAISLVAVLRQVREALDPGYEVSRVRIAGASLVPPQ
jgi:hypothetical protein